MLSSDKLPPNEDPYVTQLRKSITHQIENYGRPVVACIHNPGTGNNALNNFPTCRALLEVQERFGKGNFPVIFLSGVGSEERREESKTKGKLSAAVKHTFNLNRVMGIGEAENNKRILEAFKVLKKDGLLPDVLFLSGHSRGGPSSIALANDIWREFGMDIKIKMCFTDPVPGPNVLDNRDTLTLPPNVLSYTAFHAQIGTENALNLLLVANSVEKLRVTNPATVITAYSVPGSNHQTIVTNSRVVNSIFAITAGVNRLPYHTSLESELETSKKDKLSSKAIYKQLIDELDQCVLAVQKELSREADSKDQAIKILKEFIHKNELDIKQLGFQDRTKTINQTL